MAPVSQKRLLAATVHLLAASWRPSLDVPNSLLHSLQSIQRFLSSATTSLPDHVFQGLLAVMPSLLSCSERAVVVKSSEILEGMVLISYDSALRIANEKVTIHALVRLLLVKDTSIVVGACHVVANLSTSSQGQIALCDFRAVEKLICLLSLIADTVLRFHAMGTVDEQVYPCSNLQSQEVMFAEVLDTLNALTCNRFCERMRVIPTTEHAALLKKFQDVWKILHGDSCRFVEKLNFLCKIIFWLGMQQEEMVDAVCDCGHVVDCLFGGNDDFEDFWDNHWERLPFLMVESSHGSRTRSDLFGAGWYPGNDTFFLGDFLTRSLSAPFFNADELEISKVYEEVEGRIGKPLIYGQDIRLVKSVYSDVGIPREIDYLNSMIDSCTSKDLSTEVSMCREAYNSGYTIVLRGMEFRNPRVAAISETLALCFGQVTVGANMYLTPSNAQGFKPHLDDHCVFVWQILGSKSWKIWPSKCDLPRLYTQHTEVLNDHKGDKWRVLLNEGNVLYIPRGFPHEACTRMVVEDPASPLTSYHECNTSSESKDSLQQRNDLECTFPNKSMMNLKAVDVSPRKRHKGCHQISKQDFGDSLHITFGVEVESPFDWEGFVHMALHAWAGKQNWNVIPGKAQACLVLNKNLGELLTGLLHVAVRSCADHSFSFRKACLVAAKPFQPQLIDIDGLESFFQTLMIYVGQTANFKTTLDIVLTAIDTREACTLDWMCWLRHLSGEMKSLFWSDPVAFFHGRLRDCGAIENLPNLEVEFVNAKEKFVLNGSFSEARNLFVSLLHNYRSIRKRYVSGMLALHA